MIKSNNSGTNFMNLGAGVDPLHQSKTGVLTQGMHG